jgi:hypothetical protein
MMPLLKWLKKRPPKTGRGNEGRPMLDIPLGKAVVPAEDSIFNSCAGCCFHKSLCKNFACLPFERADGKGVIFKLAGWPPGGKKG